MIYIFTGNNHFLLRQELQKWKDGFVLKHGDLWLTHISDIESVELHILADSLLSQWLFWGKKLVILESLEKTKKEEDVEETQEKDAIGKVEFLCENIEKISPDTIVLLVLYSPDKRKSTYKKLISLSQEVKNFDTEKTPDGVQWQLIEKYGTRMTRSAVHLLVRYKANKIEQIFPEVEKLLLTRDVIDDTDIRDSILPEIEESIFSLVNALMSLQKKEIFSLFENFQNSVSVYLFYHSLLANLRTQIYIAFLKEKNISSFTIKDTLSLWNRGFLVDKPIRISYKKLQKMYIDLIEIDSRMKQGKLMGSEEKDIYFEIQKVFLTLFS